MPEFANIGAVVEEIARQQPEVTAITFPLGGGRYRTLTYGELLTESDKLAHGLEKIGLRRGMRTALMVKPSPEFFALAFALVRAGIPPIIIDPGIGLGNLKTCLTEAEPEAFIGIPTAHAARIALGWPKVETLITVGTRFGWGGYTLDTVREMGDTANPYKTVQTEASETAAIIFTSGSTGIPKGVVYNHGNFRTQVEMLRTTYGFEPGEIDLPTFPVFALFDPALGMTTVVPQMDFTRPAKVNPVNIISAVQRFGVTNMFGSPALLDRVGRYGVEHGIKLPSLRRVISAGAPVPAAVMERFAQMLSPEAEIFTPYGATEALPIASIGHHEVLGETAARTREGAGVCVGCPMPGVEIHTIRISDEAIPQWDDSLKLPPNEIGEITVRGGSVTRSYYGRPEATWLAKIEAEDGFYHRMGDVGYFDEQGRLWFCGRKGHRVETPNETLFSVPCEEIFNAHPAVYRSAMVGVKRNGVMEAVLCVELEKSHQKDDKVQVTKELLELGAKYPITRNIKTSLYHPSFPVDIRHNAKIFREKLAVWAEKQLG